MSLPPVLPLDTSLDIWRMQVEIFRRMTGEQRLDMAFQLSHSTRALSAAGVRHRHPEYGDREVQLAVIRMMIGEELFREAYPGVDVQP